MFKRILLLFAALLVFVAGMAVAQEKAIKRTGIRQTSPASGKEMYVEYCAACHGKDAKGAGPAAPSLKVPPPDLTSIAKRNAGKYPADKVSAVLRFGTAMPAHGSSEMPVWGSLFKSLDKFHDAEVRLRIKNLNDHLESLQAK